jgi:hypothetical protein
MVTTPPFASASLVPPLPVATISSPRLAARAVFSSPPGEVALAKPPTATSSSVTVVAESVPPWMTTLMSPAFAPMPPTMSPTLMTAPWLRPPRTVPTGAIPPRALESAVPPLPAAAMPPATSGSTGEPTTVIARFSSPPEASATEMPPVMFIVTSVTIDESPP